MNSLRNDKLKSWGLTSSKKTSYLKLIHSLDVWELPRAFFKIEKEYFVFWKISIVISCRLRCVRSKNVFKVKESNLDYCLIPIKTLPSLFSTLSLRVHSRPQSLPYLLVTLSAKRREPLVKKFYWGRKWFAQLAHGSLKSKSCYYFLLLLSICLSRNACSVPEMICL